MVDESAAPEADVGDHGPADPFAPVATTNVGDVLSPVADAIVGDVVAPVAAAHETPPAPSVDLAEEPDYPPPNSVPRPPPPVSLRVYAAAVVDEVAPASGPVTGGTKLALAGNHLFRASIVRIGGIIAQTVGADEPRALRVLTPSGDRPGAVDITIENPFAAPVVLAKAFRYEALAAPRITSVAPERVATKGGTELSVMGEGFLKSTVVLIDGKPVENARFVSATAIDLKAPPGDDGKMVDVAVKNPDGQTATVRRAFVYDKRFG